MFPCNRKDSIAMMIIKSVIRVKRKEIAIIIGSEIGTFWFSITLKKIDNEARRILIRKWRNSVRATKFVVNSREITSPSVQFVFK